MPLNWDKLGFEERAQAVLANIEGLDDAEISSAYEEWKKSGSESFDDLAFTALDLLAQKRGGLSGRQRARAALVRRGILE